MLDRGRAKAPRRESAASAFRVHKPGSPPPAPRTEVVIHLQRTAGNRAVAQILTSQDSPPSTPSLVAGTTKISLQRDPVPPRARDATAPAAPFDLGGLTIGSYGQAASALRLWCSQLDDEISTLRAESVAVPAELTEARQKGLNHARLLEGGEVEPIDQGNSDDLRSWHATYIQAINAGRAAQAATAATRASAAAAQLEELADKLAKLEPTLRDVQRARFRGGDEDGLLQTADAIYNIFNTAMVAKEAIEQSLDLAASLRLLGSGAKTSKTVITVAGHTRVVLDVLDKINKAYAAFQLARTAIDLVSGSKTDMESARKGVGAMATIVGAGGTLLNASAGFTLYTNLYLGPMTSACLAMLSRLEDQISKSTNRAWIELGKFDYVNWSLEPGGRPMFNFMLALMRASGSTSVPAPPSAVDDYFIDHEDDFSAGVGSRGGELPTEGWWLWKETDKSRIKSWAFRNRENLWGMLYGAAKVPTGAAF